MAGILAEDQAGPERMGHVVVGIGVNVNHTAAELGENLEIGGTSLSLELGRPVRRRALLVQLFGETEGLYEQPQRGQWPHMIEQWLLYCLMLAQGNRVSLGNRDD